MTFYDGYIFALGFWFASLSVAAALFGVAMLLLYFEKNDKDEISSR